MRRVTWFSENLLQFSGASVVFGHGMFFKAFLISLTQGAAATHEAMLRYRAQEVAAPIKNAQIVTLRGSVSGGWTVLGSCCDDD
jgi:hypothetical protein